MATYTFHVYGFGEFGVTGADPFSGATNTNPAAVGSILTLDADASWTTISVIDDEAMLHDNDAAPAQALASPIVINGVTYPAGTHVETEYEYVVRSTSSSNPADNFTIHAITMNGVIVGFATTAPIADGASYRIVAEGSSGPTVLYDDLVVCFAAGTGILTPSGERPVESLRPGDPVVTADDGVQPVAWAGRQVARGRGRRAPVLVEGGAFGARRDLLLSPQHRLIVPAPGGGSALVPVKALIGLQGVRQVPRAEVRYHHLLFERHQVIFANGAPTESLYPGPMALKTLGLAKLDAIRRALPGFAPEEWTPARPLLRPGQVAGLAAMVFRR